MPIFQQTYLVIDLGSHSIKGILFERGPLGERILRTESLLISNLEDLSLTFDNKKSDINTSNIYNTNKDVKNNKEVKTSKELTTSKEVTTNEKVINEKNINKDSKNSNLSIPNWSIYEYNIIRFVQSFFPFENTYILNIALQNIYIRDAVLPIIKKTKITHEAISFHVEEELPYTLEQLEVVGHVWDKDDEQAQVLSFAADKNLLQNIVNPLLNNQVVILNLVPDATMLASFIYVFKETFYKNKVIGQIDIGASKTILNVLYNGNLAFSRVIFLGGNDLTEIVKEKLNITFEKAELKKTLLDLNFIDLEEQNENFYKSKGLSKKSYTEIYLNTKNWFKELSIEIERSLIALKCEAPEVFYISGGVAKIKGAEEILKDILNRNVQRYPITLSNNEAPEDWITALGARELKNQTPKENCDNFLDTQFGSSLRGGKFDLSIFKIPSLLTATSILVFIFAIAIGIFHDYKQVKNNNEQIINFSKTIPEVKDTSDPEEILIQASNICQKRLVGANRNKIKFLQILNEINNKIPGPSQLELEFRRLNYDGKDIELEVDLANVGVSTVIQEKLSESKMFKNIEVKDRNILPNQKARVLYKLERNDSALGNITKQNCESN